MAEITQKLGFDAEQAIKTLDRLTGALGGANAALGKMKGAASGAKMLSGVTDGTKKATKAANEFLVGWKTIIRVLETQLIVRGLNTLITGLKDAVENARELGLAIEEVRTIDALSRTAEQINKSVLELSDAIGQAPTDLAEGLYQTLSNQVVEAGESFNFMSEAARLAKVTSSETGDAVNALSSVMNSYNLAASEAEHVSGTLFATVEQGRLRLGEIANVIGRVTPLTAQLGITWEETAASIATMTRQGVRADTAITQLRAVVTRLLKPTAEMSAIFRKWGVEDGRQAILTFGGLSGVLNKLAEETGHNSGEMAELLRNVRAIAGVFGIMSDEGKTLEEVLDNITGATKKATEAWAEYAKSDAQKLTVEMQKFDNQLTRIGVKSLPTVTTVLSAVNTFIEAQGAGLKVISGQWGENEQALHAYQQALVKGANEGLKRQRELADAGRGRYDVLTEASRLHYAEVNKRENELADTRDRAIKLATAAIESVTKDLSGLYKDSLSEITKFADEAADRATKSFERVDAVQKTMEDQRLKYRLQQAEGYYEKLAILDEASLKARKKREEAFAKISADTASDEAFRKAAKEVVDLQTERIELGKRENASGKEQLGLFVDRQKAQVRLQDGMLKFGDASKGVADNAEDTNAEFAKMEARIQVILARMDEIREDGVIDSGSEKDELIELAAEYDRLQAKFKASLAEFSAASGLDIDFNALVDGLTSALNQAHKDWVAEVERARAAFADAVIPLNVELDPGGIRGKFQDTINQKQIPGESTAAFAGRGDEAAVATLKKRDELESKIQVTQVKGAAALEKMLDLARQISESTGERGQRVDQITQGSENLLDVLGAVLQVATQTTEEAELQTVKAQALADAHVNMLETLKSGGELNRENLEAMKQQVLKLLEGKQITLEQATLYAQLHGQLKDRVELEEKIVELKEQQAPEEEIKAAEALLQSMKDKAAASELEVQQQDKIKEAEKDRTEALDTMKKATKAVTDETTNTSNAIDDAATGANTLTTNINDATGGLSLATLQAAVLTTELGKAAAQAAEIKIPSASGSGSSQYHGGPFYAAGGMFRGQDRQLTALARGETVVNRKQSRKFFSELNAMNQGSQPVYRDQGGPVTNVGDVNVTVQGGDSSQQTVREIGHALRREVKRGNITLR